MAAVSDFALIVLAAIDGSFAQCGMSPHFISESCRSGSLGLANDRDLLRRCDVVVRNPLFVPGGAFEVFLDKLLPPRESVATAHTALGRILDRECRDTRPIGVLDCACGIGTQSLGPATMGFEVTGCDVSYGPVQRARSEASKRGLSIPFSVANMVQLSEIGQSSFDAVICIDNSLPNLETNEELLQAAPEAYGKLRPGGSFIGSTRDYDRLVVERPTSQGPSVYSNGGSRRMVFQLWDWLDEQRYRFHPCITWKTGSAWQIFHFTSTYRAVLQSELRRILEQAAFTNVRWQSPSESDYYQPIFIAHHSY